MLTEHGLVSIVMPNWNCGRYIAQSIESVLAQTYGNWELLIQDDGSMDESLAVAQRYAADDPRIRIERSETNAGAAVSRNRAIARARGRWIAFLDSDDLWHPQKLERQLDFMVSHGYAFSYHQYEEMDQSGNLLGVRVGGMAKVGKTAMFLCCWPGCLTVMYDVQAIGPVQIADVKKNNDTALWLKAVRKAPCYLLTQNLGCYRRRKGSVTPSGVKDRILWNYRLYRTAEGMHPAAAFVLNMLSIPCFVFKKLFYTKTVSPESASERL